MTQHTPRIGLEVRKKAEPYATFFKMLGVELFLDRTGDGQTTVSNKRERIDDLVRKLGDILDCETLSEAEAAVLHGQLNFAQRQYYGCSLKPLWFACRRFWKVDGSISIKKSFVTLLGLEVAPPSAEQKSYLQEGLGFRSWFHQFDALHDLIHCVKVQISSLLQKLFPYEKILAL